MKPSFTYSTGKGRLTADECVTAPAFTLFVEQQLGIPAPVGDGRRAAWYKFLKKEMEWHQWDWRDLTGTVVWMKRRAADYRNLYSIYGVLTIVPKYLSSGDAVDDLRAKVSEAIQVEDDENWVRRLSLARGRSLAAVYEQWLARVS